MTSERNDLSCVAPLREIIPIAAWSVFTTCSSERCSQHAASAENVPAVEASRRNLKEGKHDNTSRMCGPCRGLFLTDAGFDPPLFGRGFNVRRLFGGDVLNATYRNDELIRRKRCRGCYALSVHHRQCLYECWYKPCHFTAHIPTSWLRVPSGIEWSAFVCCCTNSSSAGVVSSLITSTETA